MTKQSVNTFLEYLSQVEQIRNDTYDIYLFRGQGRSKRISA